MVICFVQKTQVVNQAFSEVAKIVDSVVVQGALINTIQFELSQDKQNEYKSQVLSEASADAKTKAARFRVLRSNLPAQHGSCRDTASMC